MLITVKTLTGVSFAMEAAAHEDVFSLKRQIGAKIHVTAERIRLILAGIQLEDGHTLADYNIQYSVTLHVVT